MIDHGPRRRAIFLKACLNGARTRADHAAVPIAPDDLARDAKAVVAAGAEALHVHPRDGGGRQTMGPVQVSAAVAALRAAVPGTPVGATTIASIERDPARRLDLVRRWTVRPDFVSVNWSEDDAASLASALLDLGIGIEAGLWSTDDARRFLASGHAGTCLRVLVEPTEQRTADAIATADAIVAMVGDAGPPLVVHGHERTTWPVLRWAVAHGHGIRIGLEDTVELEGGRRARDNAELVAAAARIAGAS